MNLIKTDLIDPIYDTLWEDISSLVKDIVSRPVLVIVNDYEAGSAADIQLQKMLDACKLKSEQYNIIKLKDGQMAAWQYATRKTWPERSFF